MTIEKVLENINKIKEYEKGQIHDEVICAFEDYEYEGESSIIVETESNGIDLYAFADHADAPIIRIKIEAIEGLYSVADAYID